MPKFCEHCGGVVRDDAEYCPNCGYEMEETDDLNEVKPRPETSFTPKKLLHWMKSDDEYIEEVDGEEAAEVKDDGRGTLDDLRQRYGQAEQEDQENHYHANSETDDYTDDVEDEDMDEYEEPEEYEEQSEDVPKGKGLLALFKGAFGKGDVYGDEEDEEYEDDEDKYASQEEDEEDYDQSYGIDDTISNQASIKRWKQNDESYGDEEDEYMIYDQGESFLKKIIIVCVAIIAFSALVFIGVRMFTGGEEPVISVVDERVEVLETSAVGFFKEVRDVNATDLSEYGKLYFGNYEGDETSLEADLSMFSYYAQYSDMEVQSIESSAITGNIGAVKIVLAGSEEAKTYFEESQFRLFGEEWKFDFGYFAKKLEGSTTEPSEPADSDEPGETIDLNAEKQEVVQSIRDFDSAWITYVNTGADQVFDYLNPGSAAYNRLANANVAGLNEELLELELSNVKVDGSRASIEAYEKFKKNRDGEVTIATYRWLYELKKVGGIWLVDDYSKLDSTSEVQPSPEESIDEEDPVATSGLPEGFTLDANFSGGNSSGGNEVQNVRFSAVSNRLVLEIAEDGQSTESIGIYQVKRSDDGIMVVLSGVEQFTSDAPDLSGGFLTGMNTPLISGDNLSVEFEIGTDIGYKVFALSSNNDTTARLVIDFAD
jgi:hypothetical protein